jgi:predicted transcriptional regulator
MEKRDESESVESIVADIEKLLSVGEERSVMDPSILKYLDRESLLSIRKDLHRAREKVLDEEREWLIGLSDMDESE